MQLLVSEYFSIFYAICIITSSKSRFKPGFSGQNLFAFEYDESSNETKTIFRKGVEAGCQAFIISDDVFINFLTDFYDVHDDCIQVFPNKHVVVYQDGDELVSKQFNNIKERFTSIDGEVN